jgi:myo-inositol-1-phosphate synthase
MTMATVGNTATPKKIGILIVGVGGNNGVTLVAGQIANNKTLTWETSAAGKVSAPCWNGCITQLLPKGGGVGFRGRYDLADAAVSEVGGWDIRPTPLGDALYNSRVLEYDLVRQVRDEMNQIHIMKGIYDSSFLGESQYDTATHIVTGLTTLAEKVEHIRKDIRNFIVEKEIDGHTTVIWSASVERPADVDFPSADTILQSILGHEVDCDISPSIIYAIAAALEGCSFVNGGSQNTLSPAMVELYELSYRCSSSQVLARFSDVSKNPAYVLGTDFKAGQTKFKTAAVEYIRALGLTPRVIASSNHLGNNDMLNLTSKKTITAKLRVKSNIFEPWQEHDLDHHVAVMYTPFMLDEKRDVVEYTSLGFLHSPHTMLTYTRCMDSVLCVPLMIDVAVWCDFFARYHSPSTRVARATAYLFKVPEGAAQGVDPGFQKQMQELEAALQETTGGSTELLAMLERGIAAGIITKEQAASLKAMNANSKTSSSSQD